MSRKQDLIDILGSEEAETILASLGAEEKTKALVELGIAYKGQTDLDALLEGLSRDELKELYVEIGRMLKKPTARIFDTEGKKVIKLIYKPDQEYAEKSAAPYVHPLARSCADGIEVINQQRMETKQKAQQTTALGRSFQEGIEEIERSRGLNIRQTKGKGGNWSRPNFELTAEGIEAILAYREKEKARAVTALDRDFEEGIEEILRTRGGG